MSQKSLEAEVKTIEVRVAVAVLVIVGLVGCAGRQYNPPPPPELTIARSLDALAHGANAVAKEIAILKQQGRITPEETKAIADWCRAVDLAVPRAFDTLKLSAPQDRAAAVTKALADVSQTGPLQDLIAKRDVEPEVQTAITLARTVLIVVSELVPEVSHGK